MKSLVCRFRNAILLLFGLGLVACGATARAPATPVASPPPTPVTIRFGTGDRDEGLQPLERVIAGFHQQYPWINVEIQSLQSDDYYQTLLDGVASGSGPDAMQIGEDALPRFAEAKALENLTRYLAGSAPLDATIYLPGVYRPGQWQGEPYLLPKDFSTVGVYYNKRLFDAAGVPYPKAGWTWDEFLTTAQALNQPDQGQYGVQLPASWPRGFEYWANAAGGQLISDDGSRIEGYMNSAAVVSALQFYVNLYTVHKVAVPGPASNIFGTNLPNFAAGKAAMQLFGRWPQAGYLQNPGLKDALGIVPPPVGKRPANVIAWAGFGISSSSAHKEEAWLFLRYACGPEGAREWANWGLPAVATVARERGLSEHPLDQVWLGNLSQIRPLAAYASPAWGEVGEPAIKQAIEQALTTPNADVQAILDAAARQAQQEIDTRRKH